jgi:hypothetical protein
MEYRSAWLNHTGAITRHLEVMLHALERDIPEGPLKMLLVGVDNGGPLEIWPQVLPEGSLVVAIDPDPRAEVLGLGVHIGEPRDRPWLRSVLGDTDFDVVIDRTPDAGESTWPWLAPAGRLFLEDPDPDDAVLLARDVAHDRPSWLPTEEIMRLTVFPRVLVVEKRHPRVLPYIEIMTGNFADVVPEEELLAGGVKRVLVD